jgi:hypothetical protein
VRAEADDDRLLPQTFAFNFDQRVSNNSRIRKMYDIKDTIKTTLSHWSRYGAELNQYSKSVEVRPTLNDLPIPEAEDILCCKGHLLSGRGDASELRLVRSGHG